MLLLSLNVELIYSQSFDDYYSRVTGTFDDYKSNIDTKYSDYIRGIWEKYDAYAPFKLPQEDIIPVIYENQDTIIKEEIPIKDNEIVVIDGNDENEIIPPQINDDNDIIEERLVVVDFYRTKIKVRYSNYNISLDPLNNDSIAEVLELFQAIGTNNTVADCLRAKKDLCLCDWAYMNFVISMTKAIYEDTNIAYLLSFYILDQSDYAVTIARGNGKIHLLFASNHEIYNYPYYLINDNMYYPLVDESNLNDLEICNLNNFNKKVVSLDIDYEQNFNTDNLHNRVVEINNTNQIPITFNDNVLDFYSSYPTSRIDGNDMTRWAIYAQTPIDELTRRSLYSYLNILIDGKEQIEAANILLNFVQTSFKYEYDDIIWGQDRAFFAEESLAYPYCDCEDRSILFSHIIRDLLGLDVALVYSPGHLFAAVNFTVPVEGAYFQIENRKFFICEPTCLDGAPVGWTAVEPDESGIDLIILRKIAYDDIF